MASDKKEETKENEKPAAKFGSLAKIREQMALQNNKGNLARGLTKEALEAAWNCFIETLETRKNHSAVTNFKMAKLEIIDENSFEIITESNIHQKFIEAERSGLIDCLQHYFNNKLLKYQVKLIETNQPDEKKDKPLNKKQQYQQLIEQYPNIKELKERLKLELD